MTEVPEQVPAAPGLLAGGEDAAGDEGRQHDGDERPAANDGEVNRVVLEGRLSAAPVSRELPSGDVLVSFRVVVRRPPGGPSRATSDALECVVWKPAVARRVLAWPTGARVAVEGSLRRRFWREGTGAASRTEVQVDRARLVRRSGGGASVRD